MTARHVWRAQVAGSVLLVLLALDLPFTANGWLAALSLGVFAIGVGAFLRLMIRPAPGEEVAPRRRKQLALSVATTLVMGVLVLTIAALLPAGESARFAAQRLVGGQAMRPSASDPELGWAPFAPSDVVGERLERVDPARRRILFMGDSIVMGMGLPQEETAARRLEERMPGWQVLNAAVSGYSIDQYHLYLRRILPHVRPELVIVGVFTGNDFQITGREFSWGTSKPLFTIREGQLVRANEGAACIDRLNRSMLVRVLWRDRERAQSGVELLCRPRRLQPSEHERVVAGLFDAIDETARAAKVPVLYVLLPVRGEYSGVDPTRLLYASRHATLLRLLNERPRSVLDFAVDLARQPEQSQPYLEDNAHLNAEGHRLLAGALYEAIKPRLEP